MKQKDFIGIISCLDESCKELLIANINPVLKVKKEMIEEARKKYGVIRPTTDCKNLNEGFTQYKNTLMFWFNIKDNSTKMVVRELN